MRRSCSLAGTWSFQTDRHGVLTVETASFEREIPVPLPWQAAFPDLQQYSGYAWYRRSVDLDPDWLNGELLLRFGAVDYWCQVFVNGELAGEHEGGYTPFTIPIRAYARPGQNDIALRVYDTVQTGITIPRWHNLPPHSDGSQPFDARNLPHGKQDWYINVGGIWQDVTLTAVPKTSIASVHVTPDIHTGRVSIAVTLEGETASNSTLRAVVGGVETTASLTPGQSIYTLAVAVENPKLWTPDTPNLYTAVVSLEADGVEDSVSVRFGFREIAARAGRLLLNGEPLFLLSALDQDFYPETIYSPPSDDYLRDQFAKAKALGLNSLRCHIKPPDPRYLDLADEMGLLIWAEIPSWRTFDGALKNTLATPALDEALRKRIRSTLEDMIRRDYNHPSLIAWTIVNEDWGTALPLSAADRVWAAEMYDLCKRLDPTRLVVDNSPCTTGWGPNLHVRSDIDDFHIYTNIPDQARYFRQFIEQFDLRPLWTFSSHGDAQRTGQEPLILSEFGNWGLPSLRALIEAEGGKEPAWFDTGAWWSPWDGEPGWPRGVEERFNRLGLGAVWTDYEAFAQATQWHQFQAMKFEIEAMRRQPALSGYVITEFTDTYWESNGLLDFYRHPKVYHQDFAAFNSPDVILPQVDAYAQWDDEPLWVRLCGSHYSAADWSGARLLWSVGDSATRGGLDISPVGQGEVRILGVRQWDLPKVEHGESIRLQFDLRAADGARLAHNHVDVMVLPASARGAAFEGNVAVIGSSRVRQAATMEGVEAPPLASEPSTATTTATHGGGGEQSASATPKATPPVLRSFALAVQELGYRTSTRLTPDTQVVITDYPNADLMRWVRDGGMMLFLSGGPGPFFWQQGRGGTYGGGWITAYSWLRPGIYRRLEVVNPLTLPFMHVMPIATILGLPVEDPDMQPDFLAGQISGWLRHPAVHTVQFRYGRGRVIMTTFRLREALLELPIDPVAVVMLHDLIDHLVSDACHPRLQPNLPM